jgi:hypothetical protein
MGNSSGLLDSHGTFESHFAIDTINSGVSCNIKLSKRLETTFRD